jgi:hypothetical protein
VKYVVVTPSGDLSKVYILPEGRDVKLPFESWALRDSKQILFATTRMGKMLQSQHLAGSYDSGAIYGYSFDEMSSILIGHLGPSDKQRYLAKARDESKPVLIKDNHPDHLPKWQRIGYILWKTFVLTIVILIKALTTVLFLVLLPLVLKWLDGFRK